jgi:class 3 adenylate cyclase
VSADGASGRPNGTVTFMFTDIEGSTGLLKQLGRERYGELLTEQQRLLREVFAAHRGEEIDTQGDSFFVAFHSARDAVSAAVAAERALEAHSWPDGAEVRVRIGIHTGEAAAAGERYVGLSVHRAARIGAAAHGGQVLLSSSTRELVEDDLPPGVYLRDLGPFRLKDIDQPLRLYQVVAVGLDERFPPPRTLDTGRLPLRRRSARIGLVAAALAVAAGAVAAALLALGSSSARPVRLVANSIAVINPKSGRAVGDVALGFAPTDVSASGDQVWVLNGPGRTVTAIDPTKLRVVQTIGLQGDPSNQYASGGTDWVATSGGVDEISISGGSSRPALWTPSSPSNFQCLAFVTGTANRVWVSEGRHLAEFDANSGTVLFKLTLAASPATAAGVASTQTCYGVRYAGGSLLAARDPEGSIGSLDPHTGAYSPIATVPGMIARMPGMMTGPFASWAAGFGMVWVATDELVVSTLRQRSELTGINLVSGQIITRTTIGAAAGPLAVDPTSGIWTLDPASKALRHIDPTTGRSTQTILLHHITCCVHNFINNGVAVGHGRIWVALQSP